ncbi:MAG: chromate efflux transporter [Candidatus Melainabacteria bacterium]|nr:chromate efflux transporter [Candidatus Melainabacteria bacterium]
MSTRNVSVRSIILVFLKISFTAFGGHAAHLAMMEEEVVRKRKWISHEEFLDIISAANLIPGPNSTETALHIGYSLANWRGFFAAGLSFITPTIIIVTGVAMAYVKYGMLPATENILFWIKPVIMAVISLAIYRFSKTAVKSKLLLFMLLLACLASVFKITEIAVILVIGVSVMFINISRNKFNSFAPSSFLLDPIIQASSCTISCDLPAIFLFFFKISAIIFGSGYVLYAFLYNDLVVNYQWISQAQLIDAIAIGQFTPGPVFTAATFIGYLLAGVPGALIASVGVFLPAFIYVAITSPFLSQMRQSKSLSFFLDGVNVASLALMIVVCFNLASAMLTNSLAISIFVVSLAILWRFKVNSAWLILVAAVLGFIKSFWV